jgi:hypothetical protein
LVGHEKYEQWDDFDDVIKALAKIRNLRTVDLLDGIYSRIGKFEMDEFHFTVIYHEDVGIYAFSTDDTEESNENLQGVINKVVEKMNQKDKDAN